MEQSNISFDLLGDIGRLDLPSQKNFFSKNRKYQSMQDTINNVLSQATPQGGQSVQIASAERNGQGGGW